MALWQIAFMVIITLVVFEFGLHVFYHARTGRAGVNDSAFAYLCEVRDELAKRRKVEVPRSVRRVSVTVEKRAA